MRHTRGFIALIALLLTPVLAHASHYGDFYVIPVAGHTPGALGTFWRSDLRLQNFQSVPITVDIVIVESGAGVTDNVYPVVSSQGISVTIPAGGSAFLDDVLDGHRGLSQVTGALLVGADLPFALTSRSYTNAEAGGTYGLTVRPERDFIDDVIGAVDPTTAKSYIPGIVSNDSFRSNLGFVAGANDLGGPLMIEISLRDEAGVLLGSTVFTTPSGEFNHVQFSTSMITSASFQGSAELAILGGNGEVVPYASVVDNTTGDAVFNLGNFPPSTAAAKRATPSLFRSLFDRVRSR